MGYFDTSYTTLNGFPFLQNTYPAIDVSMIQAMSNDEIIQIIATDLQELATAFNNLTTDSVAQANAYTDSQIVVAKNYADSKFVIAENDLNDYKESNNFEIDNIKQSVIDVNLSVSEIFLAMNELENRMDEKLIIKYAEMKMYIDEKLAEIGTSFIVLDPVTGGYGYINDVLQNMFDHFNWTAVTWTELGSLAKTWDQLSKYTWDQISRDGKLTFYDMFFMTTTNPFTFLPDTYANIINAISDRLKDGLTWDQLIALGHTYDYYTNLNITWYDFVYNLSNLNYDVTSFMKDLYTAQSAVSQCNQLPTGFPMTFLKVGQTKFNRALWTNVSINAGTYTWNVPTGYTNYSDGGKIVPLTTTVSAEVSMTNGILTVVIPTNITNKTIKISEAYL